MNILHLSTSGDGGAAMAARRIHRAVRGAGYDSTMLFHQPPRSPGPGETRLYPSHSPLQRIGMKAGLMRSEFERMGHAMAGRDDETGEMFTSIRSDYDILATPEYRAADLVHLHWTGGFLDWPTFFRSNRKPVVWSLCDMNPLTGGCHYDHGCGRFASPPGCQDCPQLSGARDAGWAERALAEKRRLAAGLSFPLTFVPPAAWMGSMIEQSLVFSGFPVHEIPHLGDESTYSPLPREACRSALGLPEADLLFLYVGESRYPRKGFSLLRDALEQSAIEGARGVFLGSIEEADLPPRALLFPSTAEERYLNLFYNAADAIVIPSLQENLALTFIDSQLCGTPAIAFEVGCFQDHIEEGRNGFKAARTSAEALADALLRFAGARGRLDRDVIASEAHARYSTASLLPRYLAIYRDAIDS